jgi:hypothetical protein
MTARAVQQPVSIARVLPAAFAGAVVYAERSLVITTTPAGELCAAVDGGEQILDRDDVRRLIGALEQWLGVRFEITAAGRTAVARDDETPWP